MCCTRLAGNAGPKKLPKIRHLRTIAQLCRAVFATKARIDNRKKLVKQQYLPHVSSQYGELRPTSGWDLLASSGHPSKFQRVSRLGSVTARHSSSGRQPNFAALSRGRHLYSAGRPSRWARLAHILVVLVVLWRPRTWVHFSRGATPVPTWTWPTTTAGRRCTLPRRTAVPSTWRSCCDTAPIHEPWTSTDSLHSTWRTSTVLPAS